MSGDLLTAASVASGTNPLATTAVGSLAQGLGSSLGKNAGSSSATGKSEAVFDNSGWNVIFGSGSSIKSSSDKDTSTGSGGGVLSGEANGYMGYMMVIFGAVLLWKFVKKS